MKKIILLLILSIAVFSCKNSEEKSSLEELTSETVENLPVFKGDFIDSDGAMVLMGNSFIYGVKRNEMASELTKKVAAVKVNKFDMVKVSVRGVVSKNTDKENDWEEEITIQEILEVSNTPSEADIKLNESEKKN